MEWQEWLADWLSFKRNMSDFKEEVKLNLKEMRKTDEVIMINHLPHLKSGVEENSKEILKLRKWLWLIMAIGLMLIVESDKFPQLIEIIQRIF